VPGVQIRPAIWISSTDRNDHVEIPASLHGGNPEPRLSAVLIFSQLLSGPPKPRFHKTGEVDDLVVDLGRRQTKQRHNRITGLRNGPSIRSIARWCLAGVGGPEYAVHTGAGKTRPLRIVDGWMTEKGPCFPGSVCGSICGFEDGYKCDVFRSRLKLWNPTSGTNRGPTIADSLQLRARSPQTSRVDTSSRQLKIKFGAGARQAGVLAGGNSKLCIVGLVRGVKTGLRHSFFVGEVSIFLRYRSRQSQAIWRGRHGH